MESLKINELYFIKVAAVIGKQNANIASAQSPVKLAASANTYSKR